MAHQADGKYVIVKDGKRVGELQESEAAAITEANRQRQLEETKGSESKKSEVKVAQNLLG